VYRYDTAVSLDGVLALSGKGIYVFQVRDGRNFYIAMLNFACFSCPLPSPLSLPLVYFLPTERPHVMSTGLLGVLRLLARLRLSLVTFLPLPL
jgi:hypothetical protein